MPMLVRLVAVALLTCSCAAIYSGGFEDWSQSGGGVGFFVRWSVCGPPGGEQIDMEIEVPGPLPVGYVGLAIMGQSPTRYAHDDSDLIAAWIDNSGVGKVKDYWSKRDCPLYGTCTIEDKLLGGTDDILGGYSVTKTVDGGLLAKFARNVTTGDSFDLEIRPDMQTNFAYGWYQNGPTTSSGMSDLNIVHCSPGNYCCATCFGLPFCQDTCATSPPCIQRVDRPSAQETCPATPASGHNTRGHKVKGFNEFWDEVGTLPACPYRPPKPKEDPDDLPGRENTGIVDSLSSSVVQLVLGLLAVPMVFLGVLTAMRRFRGGGVMGMLPVSGKLQS